jgi:hypothetical protein
MSSITTRKTTASVAVTDADVILIDDQGHRGNIYPDGALQVRGDIDLSAAPGDVISLFGEVSALASGLLTDILTYSVPAGKQLQLIRIRSGGTNIAVFEVTVDGDVVDRQRTWFNGSGLEVRHDFSAQDKRGLVLSAGSTVKARVIHSRPNAGDFDSMLLGVLIDEV